jgi:hypothetical protein
LGKIYDWADSKLDSVMEMAKFQKIQLPFGYNEIELISKLLRNTLVEEKIEIQKDMVK